MVVRSCVIWSPLGRCRPSITGGVHAASRTAGSAARNASTCASVRTSGGSRRTTSRSDRVDEEPAVSCGRLHGGARPVRSARCPASDLRRAPRRRAGGRARRCRAEPLPQRAWPARRGRPSRSCPGRQGPPRRTPGCRRTCCRAARARAAAPRRRRPGRRRGAARRRVPWPGSSRRAEPSAWCANHDPVRPRPVCTSSITSSAPCGRWRARAVGEVAIRRPGPHRPRPGSARGTPQRSTRRPPTRSAAASPYGTNVHPAGERLERRALRRLAGERERAHRAAVERRPRRRRPAVRPVRRASLNAASLASAPELQKNTRPSRPVRSSSRSASRTAGSFATRLDDVAESGDLPGDRLDDSRMGVAEEVHGDAADQVDVLACPRRPRRSRRRRGPGRSAVRAYVAMTDRAHRSSSPVPGSARSVAGLTAPPRADALVGEHLDEQRVRHPAVDDVRLRAHRRGRPAGRPPSSAPCRSTASAAAPRARRR